MNENPSPEPLAALSMTAHGFHRLAASRWRARQPRARLICAHGLTRNRHDFDPLARGLHDSVEVVTFDFSGRGDSDRLAAPTDYGFSQYELDAMSVLSVCEQAHADDLALARRLVAGPGRDGVAQVRSRRAPPRLSWWQRLLGVRLPITEVNFDDTMPGQRATATAGAAVRGGGAGWPGEVAGRHGDDLSRVEAAARLPLVWLGTSMGGLVGLMLAARANSPIDALVLNDVGPMVPWGGIARLSSYVGRHTRFDSQDDVEAHLRDVCRDFGPLTDEQWAALAATSAEDDGKGGRALRYDPAIARGLALGGGLIGRTGLRWWEGVDLWHLWEQVRCPVLVLRGAESDILPETVAREMQRRRPGTRMVEFPGVGHAPALVDAMQIAAVRGFVLEQGAVPAASDDSAPPAWGLARAGI
ncbi:alpha/beta fold hydrolase [Derxia gummosa]|uniref:Alpha/beta fold hydrolase n=1 Tax=Derxia gummosa DSM 723 TaxID=1121388 RepID=A0A8B6X987_9BURK|nr:alpha/beta fold hydrolase [Derxia gummosa]